MTKDEILAKARSDYPIGTKFKDAFDSSKERTAKEFDDKEGESGWYNKNHVIIWSEENSNSGQFLYYEGKWAEIISKPTPINLIEQLVLI